MIHAAVVEIAGIVTLALTKPLRKEDKKGEKCSEAIRVHPGSPLLSRELLHYIYIHLRKKGRKAHERTE